MVYFSSRSSVAGLSYICPHQHCFGNCILFQHERMHDDPILHLFSSVSSVVRRTLRVLRCTLHTAHRAQYTEQVTRGCLRSMQILPSTFSYKALASAILECIIRDTQTQSISIQECVRTRCVNCCCFWCYTVEIWKPKIEYVFNRISRLFRFQINKSVSEPYIPSIFNLLSLEFEQPKHVRTSKIYVPTFEWTHWAFSIWTKKLRPCLYFDEMVLLFRTL